MTLAGILTPTGSAPTHVVRGSMHATPVVGHTRPAIASSVTLPGFGKVSSVNVQRFAKDIFIRVVFFLGGLPLLLVLIYSYVTQ